MTKNQSMQRYINKMKELYDSLLIFLNNNDNDQDDFNQIIEILKRDKYEDDPEEFKGFLQIINSISLNHHYSNNFISKIERILDQYSSHIQKNFKNLDIFKIFESNKIILLFLFEQKILEFDEYIINEIKLANDHKTKKIIYFFFPEIKEFKEFVGETRIKNIENEIMSIDCSFPENFYEKRKKYQNCSYICSLIRQDLVEEFVSYSNKTNIDLYSEIKTSIFETNSFLIENNPTLIEYAAFFGSIQIFQYLIFNGVELNPSIWLYAIHSQNPEMIHIIENYQVPPPNGKYEECLIEAIKCHHNEIAYYIENNLLNDKTDDAIIEEKMLSSILEYHNYSYFPSNFKESIEFYYLSNFNYNKLVNLFIFENENDIKNNTIEGIYCKLLKSNIIYLFYLKEKENISKIAIPPSVKTIQSSSFSKFSSLKQVSIPSSVSSIEDHAFNKCSSLEKISIPFSVTSIREATFNSCFALTKISIPTSIISIENDAFFSCSSLKEVSIPSSVKSIGDYAFGRCFSLKQITIPSSVTSIGKNAFEYCKSLIDIIFEKPSSVTNIGKYAFSDCISVRQVLIPSSMTLIENKVFEGCRSLTQITFEGPLSITSIKDYAFSGCISLVEIPIPSSVTSIGKGTFSGCSSLKNVSIPPSVTSIEEFTFFECSSLKQIEIPASIVSIGICAFEKCASLEHISILSSVITIGKYAFGECNLLDKSDIPTRFDQQIFESSFFDESLF